MKHIFLRLIAPFIALFGGLFILRGLYSFPLKLIFVGLMIVTGRYYVENNIIYLKTLIPCAIIGLILLSNFIVEKLINNDKNIDSVEQNEIS